MKRHGGRSGLAGPHIAGVRCVSHHCQAHSGKPIPETVLLLLAGALLGPHGLGAIQSTDAINLLSDLGLAF